METVEATQTRLETFIKEYCAQATVNLAVDLSPGSVLSELLIKLSAQLHNQLKIDAELPSNVSTVKAALDSTTDTYSESIDAVASNFNVARDKGTSSTGRVKIRVAVLRTYYIPTTFQLVQPNTGGIYRTTQAFKADTVTQIDNLSSGVLRLYSEGQNGPYYFLLPVSSAGTGTNIAAEHNSALALDPNTASLDGFIDAYAFGNFNQGLLIETDRQLISRFQTGLSTRGLMSPQSMQALLPEVFPTLFAPSDRKAILAVVGANDTELRRGKNAEYGITSFGLADVYVRTAETIQTSYFPARARCYDNASSPKKWEIALDSDLAGFPSWFYELLSFDYEDDNGASQTARPLSVTFTADDLAPNVLGGGANANDVARFTKYQKAKARTYLPGVNADVWMNTMKDVRVLVSYMPNIGEIQDYILQSNHRMVSADFLVKAVVPARVSINLRLIRASSSVPNVSDIRNALYKYINNLPFGEPVVASRIIDICHNFDIKRVDLPLTLHSSLLIPKAEVATSAFPDAGSATYTSSADDLLIIPSDNADLLNYGVSSKTAMFFANYSGANGQDLIAISVN